MSLFGDVNDTKVVVEDSLLRSGQVIRAGRYGFATHRVQESILHDGLVISEI